ncbi:hypothetical protein METBIDRAFT_162823 [Metschnikowia bicuspidata var. bicuspidata NRRL YB-4993]|uniref:Uncharacterized protein n=1 Tax=Metschnikowia bicuspidata var. bicuspidata NRRL YB-4993 TaxID=869754 RepID=A0A1A0HF42_9ASCO|nr:hypothetical protein METBIDRAFT_162823 [Metschnikowia bicuspidata var. bicuspidata NRRL YB-4993]OBA22600.1 hypothetical protein METBIDRAFT_162823 [Metschnikowia bicuspidata var. bicuspidata NRRL YB-4993]
MYYPMYWYAMYFSMYYSMYKHFIGTGLIVVLIGMVVYRAPFRFLAIPNFRLFMALCCMFLISSINGIVLNINIDLSSNTFLLSNTHLKPSWNYINSIFINLASPLAVIF